MMTDEALQAWMPGSPGEARALVRLVRDRAVRGAVTLPEPPPEPDNCCDNGCIGCVWEGYYGEVAYWRDEALLRCAD